jgi:hypothetical protein
MGEKRFFHTGFKAFYFTNSTIYIYIYLFITKKKNSLDKKKKNSSLFLRQNFGALTPRHSNLKISKKISNINKLD